MKIKLTMFMFALGLGSSMAYAKPPLSAYCNWYCINEYNQCNAEQRPRDECLGVINYCRAHCDDR